MKGLLNKKTTAIKNLAILFLGLLSIKALAQEVACASIEVVEDNPSAITCRSGKYPVDAAANDEFHLTCPPSDKFANYQYYVGYSWQRTHWTISCYQKSKKFLDQRYIMCHNWNTALGSPHEVSFTWQCAKAS